LGGSKYEIPPHQTRHRRRGEDREREEEEEMKNWWREAECEGGSYKEIRWEMFGVR